MMQCVMITANIATASQLCHSRHVYYFIIGVHGLIGIGGDIGMMRVAENATSLASAKIIDIVSAAGVVICKFKTDWFMFNVS